MNRVKHLIWLQNDCNIDKEQTISMEILYNEIIFQLDIAFERERKFIWIGVHFPSQYSVEWVRIKGV